MRHAVVVAAIVLFAPGAAHAVTLRDIIELSKAGLGDEVLLALIEVDGGVFQVEATTLTRLKAAGVSERVIVALVRSGRLPRPEAPQTLATVVADQQAPDVVYVEHPPTTIVREVAVPVPVYVGVPVYSRGRYDRHHEPNEVSPLAPALTHGRQRYLTDTPPPPPTKEPVYWGSGGKLRPDAWKPDNKE